MAIMSMAWTETISANRLTTDMSISPLYADGLVTRIKELEAEVAKYKASHEALMDALIVDCIYRVEHETNPRKAINDLCYWEQLIALDPAVCSEAEKLRDTYKVQEPNDSVVPPLGNH